METEASRYSEVSGSRKEAKSLDQECLERSSRIRETKPDNTVWSTSPNVRRADWQSKRDIRKDENSYNVRLLYSKMQRVNLGKNFEYAILEILGKSAIRRFPPYDFARLFETGERNPTLFRR